MARRYRIRTSLLFAIASLIVLLAGTLLWVNYTAGQRIAEDLGDRYLEKTRDVVRQELDGFFLPVMTGIRNARVWARDGVVEPAELERSNAVYLPVLAAMPQVTSIATGDTSGFSYRLGADGENYLNRMTRPRPADQEKGPADYSRRRPDGTLLEAWTKDTGFDPRKRPWYLGAREVLAAAGGDALAARISWTDPFILNTSKNPGIAASLPYAGPGNDDLYMMTFNVMLTKLSNFTAALRPTDQGMALVLTEDGRVVGFPATETYDTPEKRLAHIKALDNRMPWLDELGEPVLGHFREDWARIHASGTLSRHRVEVDGEAWRARFEPYELDDGPPLWIGVAVPEADFLSQVREQQRMILWVSVLSLLVALGLAMWLARAFGRPLRQLARESERIRSLDLAPGEPIHSRVLETHQLATAQENMRLALDSFARYIPTEVVQELLRRGEAARLGGKPLPVSILFTDIRGFTTISEGMAPDDLSEHLAEYFEGMLTVIRDEGGAVDKMIGDAIMALWGAPRSHEAHATGAVRAALRCAAFVQDHALRCEASGRPPLWTGFGISTGMAFVGNFGAPSRLNYTALGDTVNLASRLEGANKIYGADILCSNDTRDACGDAFHWMRVDLVGLKGKTKPEPISMPLGETGEVTDAVLGDAGRYEAALDHYGAGRFQEALDTLEDVDADGPIHVVSKFLAARGLTLIENPPGDDWDGVWWMDEK